MKRRYSRRDPSWLELVFWVIVLYLLYVASLYYTDRAAYWRQFWYFVAAIILAVGCFVAWRIHKKNRILSISSQSLGDEEILYMLKGMPPAEFENRMADMFTRLGYRTELTGGANDGGIDIVAYKDGKKYFIQCKKFITREVNPHDVRDFLGAISNVNNPAEKGFFITTNGFTLMAEKAAEGNPRIELIDGQKLIQYYRMAYVDK